MKITIALTMIIFLISCKKSSNNSCTTDVASISGSYSATHYYYRTSATAQESDYTTILFSNACQRDNLLVFNSNGTYQVVDAGVVCSPPSTTSGTWALTGTTLTMDGSANTIESFDCKTLVVSRNDVNQPGDRLRIVLEKQ